MTIGKLRAAGLLAAVAALPACTDWAMYDVDVAAGEVPAFATMRDDVVPDPYQMVRLPAEGTVPAIHPLGDVPAPYTQAQLDSVAPTLTNPLRPTPTVLARGKASYDVNCAVCHGPNGEGTGPVVGPNKFPFALPLGPGSASVQRSDGYLYAVIDVGRNFMPAYGPRMTHLDRWAVVTYVRALQGGGTPAASQAVAAPEPAPASPAAALDTMAPSAAADTTP